MLGLNISNLFNFNNCTIFLYPTRTPSNAIEENSVGNVNYSILLEYLHCSCEVTDRYELENLPTGNRRGTGKTVTLVRL